MAVDAEGGNQRRKPKCVRAADYYSAGESNSQYAQREQQGMDEQHRRRIGGTWRVVAIGKPDGVVGTIDRCCKPPVEVHHRPDQGRIKRHEKHARRGVRLIIRPTLSLKEPVAEYAVMVEIVGDRVIEGLIKIFDRGPRPAQERGRQKNEDQQANARTSKSRSQAIAKARHSEGS